jgi:hypothetical protein
MWIVTHMVHTAIGRWNTGCPRNAYTVLWSVIPAICFQPARILQPVSQKCDTPVPCGGDVRRRLAPQWVQQVAVCWIQQVASCSAVLPSILGCDTDCTVPTLSVPILLTHSAQHWARTGDLVSTRLTAVEQRHCWEANSFSASREMSNCRENRMVINSNLWDKQDGDYNGFETPVT